MFAPGEYRPDPTEGITRREDLPAPQIMRRQRNATRPRCPDCGHRAYRDTQKQRLLHARAAGDTELFTHDPEAARLRDVVVANIRKAGITEVRERRSGL